MARVKVTHGGHKWVGQTKTAAFQNHAATPSVIVRVGGRKTSARLRAADLRRAALISSIKSDIAALKSAIAKSKK